LLIVHAYDATSALWEVAKNLVIQHRAGFVVLATHRLAKCTEIGNLCVVASRDFSIVKRWLLPRQLGAVGVCISLRSLNAPFSVITVKCCCRCHRT